MQFSRDLSFEEAEEFREWARDNYTVGERISEIWHPVVQAECSLMNSEDIIKDEG